MTQSNKAPKGLTVSTQVLPRAVRTVGGRVPVLIRTVDEAIDAIQALPKNFRAKDYWYEAQERLLKARMSGKTIDLKIAQEAFEIALLIEKWFYRF